MLCEVETAIPENPESEKAWEKLWKRELDQLSAQVRIRSVWWENPEAFLTISELLDDERTLLAEIIARYEDYLSEDALISFEHIKGDLRKLISRLESRGEKREEFEREISSLQVRSMPKLRSARTPRTINSDTFGQGDFCL